MEKVTIQKHDLGYETNDVIFEVEKNSIRQFAEAIGDRNPIYFDEEFAKTTPFGAIIAPPTFVTTFRRNQRIEIEGISGTRLHGEQNYYYYKPIKVGMKIKCKTKFKDLYVKKSKSNLLTFAVFEQTGREVESNEVFFVGTQTSIFRERNEELG